MQAFKPIPRLGLALAAIAIHHHLAAKVCHTKRVNEHQLQPISQKLYKFSGVRSCLAGYKIAALGFLERPAGAINYGSLSIDRSTDRLLTINCSTDH